MHAFALSPEQREVLLAWLEPVERRAVVSRSVLAWLLGGYLWTQMEPGSPEATLLHEIIIRLELDQSAEEMAHDVPEETAIP